MSTSTPTPSGHTPLPWSAPDIGNGNGGRTYIKAGSETVCIVERLRSHSPTGERYRWNEMDANALLIVQSVNGREEMVALIPHMENLLAMVGPSNGNPEVIAARKSLVSAKASIPSTPHAAQGAKQE